MQTDSKQTCSNCNNTLQGKYCHQCGQKFITAEDKKLRHFIEEIFSSLFFADGKLFKTFKGLLISPGKLSNSYIKGVRKKYINPIPLFLFVNLLYFLFPFTSTFNTSLQTQMNSFSYSKFIAETVNEEVKTTNVSFEEFEERYEQQSNNNAKLLLIVLVLCQALWFKLLFIKKKDIYFVDFFGASAYFNSFYIFTLLICFPIIIFSVNKVINLNVANIIGQNDGILSSIFLLLILSYTYFFLKKAFQTTKAEAAWKAAAVSAFIVPSFLIYRYLLFWVTFWMIR